MNRRNFFAFLPLAPFALAGSVEAEAKPDISAGEPIPEATRITFSGNKARPVKINNDLHIGESSMGGFTMGEVDSSKNVELAVGDDGHLWVKRREDKWKRVVTE